MRIDSIRYLESVGYHYKEAESPDIWTHLEHCFSDSKRVGLRFNPIPSSSIAQLIASGEDAILSAMVAQHRSTGRLDPVTEVIELPYVVGIGGTVSRKAHNNNGELHLIDHPGSIHERVVCVIPTALDVMPSTHHITVRGGLYADGCTTGYYGLQPGDKTANQLAAKDYAYLATPDDIRALAEEMQANIEDIALVTRQECDAMIENARRALS